MQSMLQQPANIWSLRVNVLKVYDQEHIYTLQILYTHKLKRHCFDVEEIKKLWYPFYWFRLLNTLLPNFFMLLKGILKKEDYWWDQTFVEPNTDCGEKGLDLD